MPIEFAYQVGNFEPPAETLRKLVYMNWNAELTQDVTPKMISPQGYNNTEAGQTTEDQMSTNDWQAARRQDYVRFKTIDTVTQKTQNADNKHIRKLYMVQIETFATSTYLNALIREQIENILFEHQPNSSRRINKTDGQRSGIVTFDRQSLEWIEIGTFEEDDVIREHQAVIGCLFQKNKT